MGSKSKGAQGMNIAEYKEKKKQERIDRITRLYEDHGMTFKEIAKIVGISRSTVNVLYWKSKRPVEETSRDKWVPLETILASAAHKPDILRFREWSVNKVGQVIKTPEGKSTVTAVYPNWLAVVKKDGCKRTWTLAEVYPLNKGGTTCDISAE